ncbi:tRNA pseudouridine(38-40) synthase TruA [Ureaplasma miroungigenitalium]|uniref:tRNA pseudouridine synthase A n=1 Tax=Ureaplasma miroungigenitalium TaxID=1042321 RepID=A0ABT3BM25_9BACT|nr:tRNA pseudouridine(38-40) synthase TruA [Ureaplasma miroungigenitalium]MCV3728298.1 tRNA pseudouridine(38-40) synthase TruA [Ureaplasma miroungigenitalium]
MNYKITLTYDGHNYYGWAVQPNKPSVQASISQAFQKAFKITDEIKVIGSGRTDRYVHALEQVCNVQHEALTYPAHVILKAVNAFLPEDIRILDVQVVDQDFHAQYMAVNKTYVYVINKTYNIYERHYAYYDEALIWDQVQFEQFKDLFLGTHDFLSYSTSELDQTVRTITDISFTETTKKIKIYVSGNGFLKNMVRMIVGSLLKLMQGKTDLKTLQTFLEKPHKGQAQAIVPGCGLYLARVNYK